MNEQVVEAEARKLKESPRDGTVDDKNGEGKIEALGGLLYNKGFSEDNKWNIEDVGK